MKKVRCYFTICSFPEAAPTLQEKMRAVLQSAIKEREAAWAPRK